MNQKSNPRKIHVGKNKIDKDNYQRFLHSDFILDQTEEDTSTISSDTSTIGNEKHNKKPIKRPKTTCKMVKTFFGENIIGIIITTTIIGLLSWLLTNDYNFNADLAVAENNITNIERQIYEYKNNGNISKNEYIDLDKEIENIKLSYAKLENMNRIEKDYEVLKISIEKDIKYLKNRVSAIEK